MMEELAEEETVYGPKLHLNIKKTNEVLEDDSSSAIYGPTLPPSLQKSSKRPKMAFLASKNNVKSDKAQLVEDDTVPGPVVGRSALQNMEETDDDDEVYGPKLPTEVKLRERTEEQILRNDKSSRIYGPTLPPLQKPTMELSFSNLGVKIDNSEDDAGDFVGPQPIGEKITSKQLKLEERALEIKLNNLKSKEDCNEKAHSREEWMLKLPEINSGKKLESFNRRFRLKEGPDFKDRSEWTKSPLDKTSELTKNDKRHREDIVMKEQMQRDCEQERLLEKHGKKQKDKKSLLEIHRSKMKSKEKAKSEKYERRPFNREVDLQLTRLNQAGVNSVIEKARVLDTRFTAGKAKYL